MGDKFNIDDSIEIANLKKYAEDAVREKDRDAALEAILLEYSKDVRQVQDEKAISDTGRDITVDMRKNVNPPVQGKAGVDTDREKASGYIVKNKEDSYAQLKSGGVNDISIDIEMISNAVSQNIEQMEKDIKSEKNTPKEKKGEIIDTRDDKEKRNAELLRLAFGTSQFEKVHDKKPDNIDKTKNFSAVSEVVVPVLDERGAEEKKGGIFSRALSRAKKYAMEDDEDDSNEQIEEPQEERQTLNPEINQEDMLKDEGYTATAAGEPFEADEYDEVYDFLFKAFKRSKVKTICSFIFAVILIALSVIDHMGIMLPSFLTIKGIAVIPVVTVIIFAVMILMNFSTIKSGAHDLFTKRVTMLSFLFLSVTIVFLHSMYSMVLSALRGQEFISYAGAIAFMLLIYNIGARLWAKAHFKNFEEIYAASSSLYEVRNAGGDEELEKIALRFAPEDAKSFYYNVSVGSTGGFLYQAKGGEQDTPFKNKTILIILAAIVVMAVLFSFLKGFNNFIFIFVSAFAMLTPVNFSLVNSFVFARSAKKARKKGAVVAGAKAAQEQQFIDAIMLKDRDIFPDGSVVIKGVKVISSDHINDIISYVASIFVTIDSPAKIAFLDLIDNKTNLLKDVYFFECFESEGIIAFIEGDKILLGSSDFMIKNGIIPPADSVKNFKGGRSRANMYVAMGGKLSCIFSMGYLLDREIEYSLKSMEREYIRAAVATFDPNLSAPLLCKRFSLSDDSLSIMRSGDVMKFNKIGVSDDKIGRSGLYLTQRDAKSFIALIKAVKNISFLSKTNHFIMMAALIAAPVLWAAVIIMGGLFQITPFAVILFHFLWCIPVFINSLFA